MEICQICGRETYLIQCSSCQRYTCEFCIALISQMGWVKRQHCLFCGTRFKEYFRKQKRGRIRCLNLACKACYPAKEEGAEIQEILLSMNE